MPPSAGPCRIVGHDAARFRSSIAGTRDRGGGLRPGGSSEPGTIRPRSRGARRPTRPRGALRQLKHSGGLRARQRPGVPSVPAVCAGICSGDVDAVASRRRPRPGPRAGDSRRRESSRTRHQHAGALDRSPAARQVMTPFVVRPRATSLCYAFVLRLRATPISIAPNTCPTPTRSPARCIPATPPVSPRQSARRCADPARRE